MKGKRIAVIGGDKRQVFLIESLRLKGYDTVGFGIAGAIEEDAHTLQETLSGADAVVLPYPVSPDGVFVNASSDKCDIRLSDLISLIGEEGVGLVFGGGFKRNAIEALELLGTEVCDYGESEALKIKNALCTAEGAISIAMKETEITLHGSRATVIGYGRIGRLLSERLIALGAKVSAVARSPEALACAYADGASAIHIKDMAIATSDTDLIFNTVPSLMLDRNTLASVNTDTLIIDLASSPGGVDMNEAKRLGLKVIWALSLPGKHCPKTAAEIIREVIEERFERTRNR